MSTVESYLLPQGQMQPEDGPSSFATLLREEGDNVRRDSFTMIDPAQSASGRVQAGYTTIYPGCSTRGHTHPDREEVYYFVRGEGVMVADGEETSVRAGDTFYLKPGPFHIARNPGALPLEYFWITIRV